MPTMLLFDHDYLVEAYAKKQAIKHVVGTCKYFGASIDETIHRVAEEFGLNKNISSGYVHEFWRNGNDNDVIV